MTVKFKAPYSIEATGCEKKDGETAVYRHFLHGDKLLSNPPRIYTMWQMYLHGYYTSTSKLTVNCFLPLF